MFVDIGDTFLFDPEGRNQPHLWVVVHKYTPEFETKEFAVIVHITSVTNRTDPLLKVCVLSPTDDDRHPYVAVPSYVHYQSLAAVECDKLIGQRPHDQVCAALLGRIRRGLHRSSLTKKSFKKLVPND